MLCSWQSAKIKIQKIVFFVFLYLIWFIETLNGQVSGAYNPRYYVSSLDSQKHSITTFH